MNKFQMSIRQHSANSQHHCIVYLKVAKKINLVKCYYNNNSNDNNKGKESLRGDGYVYSLDDSDGSICL